MTKAFSIDKIAIIGAGPGGLSAAYEFLHTGKNDTFDPDEIPENPAFSKIVVFEQQDDVGGVWNTKVEAPDPGLPPREFLENETYHDATKIHPNKVRTLGKNTLKKIVEESSVESPVVLPGEPKFDSLLQWSSSAIYEGLFTNVPKDFLQFSNFKNDKYNDIDAFESTIDPLVNFRKLLSTLRSFADKYGLRQYIRFNSQVEHTQKKDGKWELIVRHKNPKTGLEEWYSEKFDAVLVAAGHYSVPFIPKIEGLGAYALEHPDAVIHNKAWRSPDEYKDKTVLFVGGSLSSLDILQYVYPVAKKTYISRRNYGTPERKPAVFPWLDVAAEAKGIVNKPGIKRFDAETGDIEFADGLVEKGIDKIIFSTGYHTHFPFLEKSLGIELTVEPVLGAASSTSRVKGLFHHIFSIEDPTLALAGMKITSLNWMAIEAANSAVAGVWSNARSLPSKEEQLKWEADLVKEKGDHIGFHYSDWKAIRKEYIDHIKHYFVTGRKNPFDEYTDEYIDDEMERTQSVLEKTFFKFKDGEFKYEDTI